MSHRAIKRQARKVMHSYYPQQWCAVMPYESTFIEAKAARVKLPYNNALVITVMVMICHIHQILVDNGSSAVIFYMEIFRKINVGKDKLRPIKTPLKGFGGRKYDD